MDCERIEQLLSPYLEDELSPEEKQAVGEHLKTCQDCSELLSFLTSTRLALANFPEAEVSESLLKRLYQIPQKKKRFSLGLDFFLRPSLQPVLTIATVLLTLVSFYFFHPNRNLINKSINRQIHQGYSEVGRLYTKAESFTASLGEYKELILFSLKETKLFGGKKN
ncbi:anti-sigma factor family protein [Acidobacteriota bacterium]